MKTVLVVDDNVATADALGSMLSLLDLEAVAAYSTRSALEMLERIRPAAVFLDLNMPGVNGIEVLGFLKREPQLEDVPVIVVTSDDQPETHRRVREAGALEVIVKPAALEALESALRKAKVLE